MTARPDDARLAHFRTLSEQQQREAINHLHVAGYSVHAISNATQLSLEQVQRVLTPEIRP